MNTVKISSRDFAITAHDKQMYGEYPYVKHLDDVAELVRYYSLFVIGSLTDIENAAYLHDCLEDTSADPVVISLLYGPKTLSLVSAVTKTPGISRKLGFDASMKKIADAGQDAVTLKLCDRIANVRSCIMTNKKDLLEMYRGEHDGFVKILRNSHDFNPAWGLLNTLFISSK